MFDITTGRSNCADARSAGREAALHALMTSRRKPDGSSSSPNLAIVFGSAHYPQQQLIDGAADVLGMGITLVGCSCGWQISADGVEQKSVVVMLIWSGFRLGVRPVMTTEVRRNPFEAGVRLGVQVRRQAPHSSDITTRIRQHGARFVTIRPYTLLLFADMVGVDSEALIAGVNTTLGPGFQIVGGVASDDGRAGSTAVYINREILRDAVVGVVIAGRIPTAVSACHGCSPDSRRMSVTRSTGNLLQELDGRAPLDVYLDTFGASATNLTLRHLVGIPEWNGAYRLRSTVRVQSDGALMLTAAAPQGSPMQWMACSAPCVADAAQRAVQRAIADLGNARPAAALVFSSNLLLWRNDPVALQHKLAAIRKTVGESVPIIGLNTFGEFASPPQNGSESYGHTCVIFLLGA